jgi:hypothetical protein
LTPLGAVKREAPPAGPAALVALEAGCGQASARALRRLRATAPPIIPNPPSIIHAAAGSGTTPVLAKTMLESP